MPLQTLKLQLIQATVIITGMADVVDMAIRMPMLTMLPDAM
jgi:hypothetical protein